VVPITTSIEGSKVCLEYHIFHYPGPTFIQVGGNGATNTLD
jgi:hypothetical protein